MSKQIPELDIIATPTAGQESLIETVVARHDTYATSRMTLAQIFTLGSISGAIKVALDAKQASLVSGTNIKTINGSTILWSGDLTIASGGDMNLSAAQTNSGVKTFLDWTMGLRNVANTSTSFFTNTNTASRTYTLVDASGTIATTSSTNTITNKRNQRRNVVTTESATPTINTDNGDIFTITALAQNITSFTTNLSGTAVEWELIEIQITDNGTARTLTFGTSFEATTVSLPTTTVISAKLRILFQWNGVTSKWSCIAVS